MTKVSKRRINKIGNNYIRSQYGIIHTVEANFNSHQK